ncbi:MAG: flagellar filament capping protein FliD [Planctomycetes bacterium]|nr:flagellar filament capping protein FliD [Planctomycetota bacterium]
MSITTGIGLISGIDTATLIDQLLALESRPKINLQVRLANLQNQQSAFLDINARLLNLKTTSAGLRTDSVFQSILAASSDTNVLNANPVIGGRAQPGTFSFLVKQLVSTSQKITRGFTDTGLTPVGLTKLSFELGNGFVVNDTELADLNAGNGVARGKIQITDTTGTTTVDLTTATTVGEVIESINSSGANVTASASGDHFVITENTLGTLIISEVGTGTTAASLGIIENPSVLGVITGNDIRTLGGVTPLSSLNDGTGVLIVASNPDISITTRSDRVFNVDFGRIDNPIDPTTLIEDLNNGQGITTNPDSEEDIKFIDRDGTEHLIDLTGIVTVQDFMDRVSDQSQGKIVITVHADGDKFTVTDTTMGTGLLKVLGAGPLDTQSADDLGILETDGVDADMFDGTLIPNADNTPAATTLQQIVDRINNAIGDDLLPNAGDIVASIAPDLVSLQVEDTTGGGPPSGFTITSTTANPSAVRDLGLEGITPVSDIMNGNRLIAGLNSVLVRSLNGGNGLSGFTALDIIDRVGGSDSFSLDEDGSLSEIIALINASTMIDVTASINDAGNGLLITDNATAPTSNLIIEGDAAAELNIDTGGTGVASSTVRGDDLELRYVSNATAISQLNYGRGIGTGSFRITDGQGNQVIIEIDDQKNVFEIIREINGQAGLDVDILARINDTGDGIIIDNNQATGLIRVESISGTTARDLRLEGQATTEGGSINGSFEVEVTLNASDTLNEIIQAINDAGIPVNATVLNTGTGAIPFRLVFNSEIAGKDGDLLVDDDGFGLNLTTLSEASDSKVFFGSDDPTKATLIKRSSNTLTDVLQGVSIDLVAASDTAVTVTITRDTETIEDKIGDFVAAFNDSIQRIDQYDFFSVDTEQRGVLLGNSTTARIRGALLRTVQGPATGVESQFQFLSQVGIKVGANSNLTFDRNKFQEALQEDFDAVVELFTAFKGATTTTEQIAPGVTITKTTQTFSELGFGDLFDQLLDGLTNSIDGTVKLADESLQRQIDLTTDRIEAFDDRLDRKRQRMERDFTAMEIALARLQFQQGALFSLINNLAISQGLF